MSTLPAENPPIPAVKMRPGWKQYGRILRYLRPYRGTFIAGLLCMVVFGATDGGVPILVKYALERVFVEQNKELLTFLPLVLISFALLRAVCDFAQQYLTSKVGHLIVRDLRNELNEHFLTLPPDFFVKNSSADLVARSTSDVILLRSFFTDSMAAVIRDSIRIVALLCTAIYFDARLAAIAFIAFPLGVYPVYRFGRKMRKLARRGQEAIGTISGMMQESILGNRVVKIFLREKFEQQRFRAENEALTRTFIKSERFRAITGPINEVLASFAVSGVILYGGYMVLGGLRSQGDFLAFIISVFLLYDPFKKLSRVSGAVQQAMAGADRLFETLDSRSEIVDPPQPQPLPGRNFIELEQVDFYYRTGDQKVLSGINLSIAEGRKIAIVGFSGAGKSTLVDLIPRFIDPSKGTVKIGGVDIAKVRLADLRSRIAMVGQHTFLFNDTIFNNIAYGSPGATEEEVFDAAKAAYAYDFVMQLPRQFSTVIGEAGLSLSGGERQRIAIARAILKRAPILILDEATASLDNRSEREVQSAIEALEKGKTSLVIAHRLSTVRHADEIVVLREGQIVERGTHDELLKREEGEYTRLYRLQFAEEKRV